MLAESSLDDLLGELYGTVLDPDRLDGFLGALSRASGSHLASMTRQDFRDPGQSRAYSNGASAEELARYAANAGDNIWVNRSRQHLRTGAVFNSDDWVGLAELRRSRYYNEFLRAFDTVHSVALCGETGSEGATLVTLCRSGQAGPYDEGALALLGRLGPHWANACALRQHLREASIHDATPASRATAVFLLDRGFRLRDSNAAAGRMLSLGWWSVRQDGAFEAAPASRAAWRQAQREATGAPTGRGHPILAVHDAHGLRVAFAALHPLPPAARSPGLSEYVLVVRPLSPPPGGAPDGSRVRALFGLTAAEAALAMALHRAGDLRGAAAALGIGERGARTRLQSLFEKTDCRRQSELLRLLDTLVELGA